MRSSDEHIRSNIVICIGDLCYRFPNQLEQWTSRIYGTLRDEVRRRSSVSFLVRVGAHEFAVRVVAFDSERYGAREGEDRLDRASSG